MGTGRPRPVSSWLRSRGLTISDKETKAALQPCSGAGHLFPSPLPCMSAPSSPPSSLRALGSFIFLRRWLQAPLYFGLILAQGVYVYHFFLELWHLLTSVRGLDEKTIMLIVLGLIDVVMIANLLIMVIVG